ncbi:cupin domain-containing protein [Hymenobacter sp. BT175]|uniref:cupin domain-containing protein n=1 Tax=Hymenobacter translucens TaxID=2886507 RepID=UPI001D0E2C51|nr:cupin domain-containing protein [Hymenobacter translucens]MCC2546237.1 cupin domain-containing protein [Hymenobacter translucens]
MTASDIIRQLDLLPHPEGGYYRETYRSESQLDTDGGIRSVSTAIYYLLENEDKSHFHRIKSDELWFFHQGQALDIVVLDSPEPRVITLGSDFANGEVPQAVIPANAWFGARLRHGAGFTLVSCTVAPGFDFLDFELAGRTALTDKFPHLSGLVEQFTKP